MHYYYLIKDDKIIGVCNCTKLEEAMAVYDINDDPDGYELIHAHELEDSQIIDFLDEVPSWDWDYAIPGLFQEIASRYDLNVDDYDEYEPLWDDVLNIYNTK